MILEGEERETEQRVRNTKNHSYNTVPELIATTIDVPRYKPIKYNTTNTQVQERGGDGDATGVG